MIPGTHRGYRCALRPVGRRRARATQGVCEGGRNYPRRGVRNHAPLGACLNTLSSSIFHAERCVVKLSEKGREWHRELFFNEESKRAHVKKERNPVKKWPESAGWVVLPALLAQQLCPIFNDLFFSDFFFFFLHKPKSLFCPYLGAICTHRLH